MKFWPLIDFYQVFYFIVSHGVKKYFLVRDGVCPKWLLEHNVYKQLQQKRMQIRVVQKAYWLHPFALRQVLLNLNAKLHYNLSQSRENRTRTFQFYCVHVETQRQTNCDATTNLFCLSCVVHLSLVCSSQFKLVLCISVFFIFLLISSTSSSCLTYKSRKLPSESKYYCIPNNCCATERLPFLVWGFMVSYGHKTVPSEQHNLIQKLLWLLFMCFGCGMYCQL